MNHPSAFSLALASLGLPAAAQTSFPLTPFPAVEDVYVTDAGTDSVFRLQDTNYDGDYNDAGEVALFYDEDLGTLTLGNNNTIAVDSDGVVYICDTSSDFIVGLVDLNGDGDAHEPGEHWVFFDGDPAINLSGLEMVSPNNMVIDLFGVMWIAEANNGGGGIDSILRIQDLDGDGDANDLGEAERFFVPANVASVGDSVPQGVTVGQDGNIYYLDIGSTGSLIKGVYRLVDQDGSGDIDPSSEVSPYFLPAAQANTAFFWNIAQDENGYWYMADSSNELIWRFRDENNDGSVDPLTEAVKYWESPGSSLIWSVQPSGDGRLLVAESQTPDRILLMEDLDQNGSIDPVTEVVEAYNENDSPVNISNPRGCTWKRRPLLSAGGNLVPGGQADFVALGTRGDLVLSYYSNQSSAPFLVAPFGFVELDLAAVASGNLYVGVCDDNGTQLTSIPLPNSPGVSGLQLFLQGVVGKADRLQLTPLAQLNIP